MQNMEQLHAHDCHTEPQATEYHKKYTHVQHRNCQSGLSVDPRSKRGRIKGLVSTVTHALKYPQSVETRSFSSLRAGNETSQAYRWL